MIGRSNSFRLVLLNINSMNLACHIIRAIRSVDISYLAKKAKKKNGHYQRSAVSTWRESLFRTWGRLEWRDKTLPRDLTKKSLPTFLVHVIAYWCLLWLGNSSRKCINQNKNLQPASWSSGNVFVSGAGGLRFISRAGQIEHGVANGSPPTTIATFLRKELYCPGTMTRRWVLPTRCTLRRSSASIMKDLIWKKNLLQPRQTV